MMGEFLEEGAEVFDVHVHPVAPASRHGWRVAFGVLATAASERSAMEEVAGSTHPMVSELLGPVRKAAIVRDLGRHIEKQAESVLLVIASYLVGQPIHVQMISVIPEAER